MTIYLLLDVIVAYLLDLMFGDPYWMPHPVRFIGSLIKNTERVLRKWTGQNRTREKVSGFVLLLFVVSVTFIIAYTVLSIAMSLNIIAFHFVNVFILYTSLSSRCLGNEALKVYDELVKPDLQSARERLAMLVGRETDNLDEAGVVKGVVETTAENTTDGIVSPLFYIIIGSLFGIGAPLVYAFKAVSTLDSMVGYKNERYINMGMASAKFDDVLNYIPARLTGLLIPLSAFMCRTNYKKSLSIMLRDRRNHKSPNCAFSEAAVAGALGIRIGGSNVYFGKVIEKPVIGDADKPLEARDIRSTVKLMYVTSFLAVLPVLLVIGLVLIV